jgi:hypothetical protein
LQSRISFRIVIEGAATGYAFVPITTCNWHIFSAIGMIFISLIIEAFRPLAFSEGKVCAVLIERDDSEFATV